MTQLNDIIVRPLTMADFAAVNVLFKQIDEQHYHALPGVFKRVGNPPRPHEHIEQLIADENRLCVVAVIDGEVVGSMLCRLADTESFVHQAMPYVHISEIVVAESHFGRGVAQALMTTAKQWAHEKNASKLDLNVYAFNQRAIRFYEKEGFYVHKLTMRCDL